MTNKELQKSIDSINEQELKDLATFGFFAENDDWETIAIRANKEGLQLFALELLKASQQAKSVFSDKEKNIIKLDPNAQWINPLSDIKVFYIEQVDKTHEKEEVKLNKETFTDKTLKYGCFAVLILLVIALIVGLWTLGKWLF